MFLLMLKERGFRLSLSMGIDEKIKQIEKEIKELELELLNKHQEIYDGHIKLIKLRKKEIEVMPYRMLLSLKN